MLRLASTKHRIPPTDSYKNHKVIRKGKEDWGIIENNHEPIISQELWDKVNGKVTDEVCKTLLEKYQAEKTSLQAE